MVKFIHTADWQLGKPFAGIGDDAKRSTLQRARSEAVALIGEVARRHGASFVLVAGDLFDSPNASKTTVVAALSAIGQIGLPVIAIPGNHDHAGAGCTWDQDFFKREQASLAPHFRLLREEASVEIDDAVIFPCPLVRRQSLDDPTSWLRRREILLPASDKPRILLAHGSVQGFSSAPSEDEDVGGGTPNLIELDRLPLLEFDYVALGDWHGTFQANERSWYSGAVEQDRQSKGDGYVSGQVLVVEAERGAIPLVRMERTGRIRWHDLDVHLSDDSALDVLDRDMRARIETRVDQDVMKLTLRGILGIGARERLDHLLESWSARLLRLKLDENVHLMPTEEELEVLAHRGTDPVIAGVTRTLVADAKREGDEALVAQTALRELFTIVNDRGARR